MDIPKRGNLKDTRREYEPLSSDSYLRSSDPFSTFDDETMYSFDDGFGVQFGGSPEFGGAQGSPQGSPESLLSTSEGTNLGDFRMRYMANRDLELGRSQSVLATKRQLKEIPEDDSKLGWVIQQFESNLRADPDLAVAVAAVTILTEVIKRSKASTMYEVQKELLEATRLLRQRTTSISISSGCALFNNFVTRAVEHTSDFEQCKKRLIQRGESFRQKAFLSRAKVGENAVRFIGDGLVVLTQGFSRVVLAVLLRAHEQNKRFRVIVAESRPDNIGYRTAMQLQKSGIPVTLTTDNAVAHVMSTVDLVLVGAEAVVENGGIISRIGTYGLSIVAKELKKPFYVASESFKFTRMYPLNQRDIPENKKKQVDLIPPSPHLALPKGVEVNNPPVDYTPPQYITLLFTDLGVLTPSAISDELIKLYY